MNRDYYERGPDGATWPPTLRGLVTALRDTAVESAHVPGATLTLSLVTMGSAVPIRHFQAGAEVAS